MADLAAETFEIEVQPMLIYFEDFDNIEATDKAGILAEIGWKDGIIDDDDSWSTYYQIYDENGTRVKFNTIDGHESWSNTGLYASVADLSVKDGVLTIDNKTNNPNGAYASFTVRPNGYIAHAVKAYRSLTVQYDIEIKEAKENVWVGVGINDNNGYSNPDANWTILAGWYSRIHMDGLFSHMCSRWGVYRSSEYDFRGPTSDGYGKMAAFRTKTAPETVLETLFGGADDVTGTKMTVRTVWDYDSDYQEIWVKVEGSDEFVLISSGYHSYSNGTEGAYDNDITFVIGGNMHITGTDNGIKSLVYGGQNTTNAQEVVDGDVTYNAFYSALNDASAIIEIDNFAAWVGHGEMPEHGDTATYASKIAQ